MAIMLFTVRTRTCRTCKNIGLTPQKSYLQPFFQVKSSLLHMSLIIQQVTGNQFCSLIEAQQRRDYRDPKVFRTMHCIFYSKWRISDITAICLKHTGRVISTLSIEGVLGSLYSCPCSSFPYKFKMRECTRQDQIKGLEATAPSVTTLGTPVQFYVMQISDQKPICI